MTSMWWWKCLMFIGAVESVAACRSTSSYLPPTGCIYSDDIKTFDCTDVKLESLVVNDCNDKSREVLYILIGNTQLTTLHANVFSCVPNLLYLNASHNFLEVLDFQIFKDLTHLRVLDLSYNMLVSLHDELLFQSQANLISLILSHNKLTTLDSSVLDPLKSIKILVLSGNPFVCNCQLRLTMEWCSFKNLDTKATCELPRKYSGSPWSVLSMSEICKVPWTDSEINTTEHPSTTEHTSTTEHPSTTESSAGNSTASELNAENSVTTITVYVCVAVVILCIVVVASLYFWKKRQQRSTWETARSKNNLTENHYTDINPQPQKKPLPSVFPGRLSSDRSNPKEQTLQSNEMQLYDYAECNTTQQNSPRTSSELPPNSNTVHEKEQYDSQYLYANPLYMQRHE